MCAGQVFSFRFSSSHFKCFVIIINFFFASISPQVFAIRTLLLLWDVTRFIFWNKFGKAQHYTSKEMLLNYSVLCSLRPTWLTSPSSLLSNFLLSSERMTRRGNCDENGWKEMRKKHDEKQKEFVSQKLISCLVSVSKIWGKFFVAKFLEHTQKT